MAKTLHFGSFDKYKRWLAAGHIHNLFRHHGGKGTPTIKIQGKLYKPSHSNPAELVIFGNPRRGRSNGSGSYTEMLGKLRGTYEGYLRQGWTKSEAAKQALRESTAGSKVKQDFLAEVNLKNPRSGNNHAAGCSCPICKNMRAAGVSNPRRSRNAEKMYVVMERTSAGVTREFSKPLPKADAKQMAAEMQEVARKGRSGFRYKVRRARNPRRRNQAPGEDMTQAVELYEAFQGKDADKVIERSVSDEMRHNYVALGKLVAVGTGECNVSANRLVGEYDHQPRIDFEGDGVILACSPDGAQLYFIGGRQTLDTAALKRLADDASKDIFDLGECGWVVYSAAKAPDYQTTSYVHKFGEESASSAVPRLIYDGIRKQFFLAGGEYHVDAPGIIN